MADRFPLIANSSANQIQEIPTGDQLNLSGNNIANAGIVTATTFSGSGASLTNLPSAQLTGALPAIDGSNLTGIDSASITTGTTKVQTAATSIVNQISGAGIATITAQGLNVTGIVTATSFKVFDQGIDNVWSGGSSTLWYENSDMVSTSSWPATKGGSSANLVSGLGGTNGLTYTASDAEFNNHKSLYSADGGSGCLVTSTKSNNTYWNATEAFTILIVFTKQSHGSGTSLGDGLFVQNYVDSGTDPSGSWSLEPFGDHTWGGQYGEVFGYTANTGGVGYNYQYDYPIKGIWCYRQAANFDHAEILVNYGFGWDRSELRHTGPSGLPSSNFKSISFLNFDRTTSANHDFTGKIAEMAYWKGTRLAGNEFDSITRYFNQKFKL